MTVYILPSVSQTDIHLHHLSTLTLAKIPSRSCPFLKPELVCTVPAVHTALWTVRISCTQLWLREFSKLWREISILQGKHLQGDCCLYLLSALWPTDKSPCMYHSTQVWAEALLLSRMKLWRGWGLWEPKNLWIFLQLPYPDHSPPLDVKHVFNLRTRRLASVSGRLLCFKLLRGLETDLPLRFAQHSMWKSLWLV